MPQMTLVRALLTADVPVLLWGPPGTGKTATVYAEAKRRGAHVEVLVGSLYDPTDIGGQMIPDASGRLHHTPPPWALRLRDALGRGQPAWLFLDELSCAPAAVRAAMLRLILERKIGDCDLSGCRIIGASNPTETAADNGWLDASTANRLAHIDWKVDARAWVTGTLSGWGKPPQGIEAACGAAVASFIAAHPMSLLALPERIEESGRAWPSPRSWTAGIKTLAALGGPDASGALDGLTANVGTGVAGEWATWLAARDLPDGEALLQGRAPLPERPDQLTASVMALVAAALSEHAERNARVSAAWKLIRSLRPDVTLVGAKALLAGHSGRPDEAVELADRIRAAKAAVTARAEPVRVPLVLAHPSDTGEA